MIQLETIEISNARRLAENVKIEFGKGVTILVAPNGTGKTTIFEAIELAITDDIQRPKDKLGSVVSDSADNMSVRLDFNDGQHTKVILDKYGNKSREGDIKKILDVLQDISILHLFKMTHFLEQNSKNWFVGCDGSEAGKLLSSLPIGRDVQNILTKKTSVLKALTNLENNAVMELGLIKADIKTFEELKGRMDDLKSSMPYIEAKDLLSKMKALALKYDIQVDALGDKLGTMSASWELVKNKIVENKDANLLILNKLSAFENRIDFYWENEHLIAEKKQNLTLQKQKKEEKEKKLLEISNQRDIYSSRMEVEEEAKAKTDRILSNFNAVAVKGESINEKRAELEKYKKEFENIVQDIVEQNKTIEKYMQLKDRQKAVQESLKNEKEKLVELQEKQIRLQEWERKKTEVTKLNEKLNKILDDVDSTKRRKESIMIELHQSEQKHFSIKENLSLLRKSEEDTLSALTIIRKTIRPDTKICPVCQAEYPQGELDKRISKVLGHLNPLLDNAIIEEKEANELVMKQKSILLQVETELTDLGIKYEGLKNEIEELSYSIEKIKKEVLIEEDGVDLEKNIVEQEIAERQGKIARLQNQQKELPLLDTEGYQVAEETKRIFERKETQLKSQINSLEIAIANESQDIDFLKGNLIGENQENELEQKKIHAVKIEEYQILLDEYEKHRTQLQDEINKLGKEIIANEDEVSSTNALQACVIKEWKEFNVGDTPDKKAVKMECDRLKDLDLQMETDLHTFYILRNELSVWKSCQERELVEGKLREQAGEMDIEQYHQALIEKLEKKQNNIKLIKVKKEAAKDFLDEITNESKKIQTQLGLINDTWREILKRMIVNPLIASAPLLENKTSYNKQIASTKVQIHNEGIDIVKMASEGQIADLQLSFLLAMASRYSWTPWKALLLDDPMQHHDLVHTSSVLDLLRDYIVGAGYQIMLSTHDLLQADYFARKFSNDGIEYKIYQLVPRKGGVIAERIH